MKSSNILSCFLSSCEVFFCIFKDNCLSNIKNNALLKRNAVSAPQLIRISLCKNCIKAGGNLSVSKQAFQTIASINPRSKHVFSCKVLTKASDTIRLFQLTTICPRHNHASFLLYIHKCSEYRRFYLAKATNSRLAKLRASHFFFRDLPAQHRYA